jgi:hypothetical protein
MHWVQSDQVVQAVQNVLNDLNYLNELTLRRYRPIGRNRRGLLLGRIS